MTIEIPNAAARLNDVAAAVYRPTAIVAVCKVLLPILMIALAIACDSSQSTQQPPDSTLSKTAPDLQSAVEMLASAAAGTSIVVPAGTYTLRKKLEIKGVGEAGRPVSLTAQNGDVRIEGRTGFDIVDSNWLVVEGFTLSHQGQTTNVSNSDNVRLSRINFRLSPNPTVEKNPAVITHWLRYRGGKGHRLDHSEFGPHPGGLGVTLLVENAVESIRIDSNYFHDRPRDGRNGAETIRLGSGGGSTIAAVIEGNLFERCHGEAELISIKSDGAIIRDNTFRDNDGQLVVRNGSNVMISGNYFIGTDPSISSGGVRVHGRNICVSQNYFAGLATPALRTFPGNFAMPRKSSDSNEPGAPLPKGYPQTTDVVFAGNIIVGDSGSDGAPAKKSKNRSIVDTGSAKKSSADALPSARWTIANNLVLSDDELVGGKDYQEFQTSNNTFRENVQLQKTQQPDGSSGLRYENGLWRLDDRSTSVPESLSRTDACRNPATLHPVNLAPPLQSTALLSPGNTN